MFKRLKHYLRRCFRAVRRRGDYPILLPHFEVLEEAVRFLGKDLYAVANPVARALSMCDGRRTIGEITKATGISPAELMHQHEEGRLIFWHAPLADDADEADTAEVIVVSPHPDDAPLSLGGRMLARRLGARKAGVADLVINVFSRTAWTRFPRQLADAEHIAAVRAEEEELVARLAHLRLRMLGLPEAMLRGHKLADVFTAAFTQDDDIVRGQLTNALTKLAAANPKATWYLPLGIGNHIDHRIVQQGSLAALQQARVPEEQILFYEELPYAVKEKTDGDFIATLNGRALVRDAVELKDALRWKLEMSRVYWSQFTWTQIKQLGEYAERIGSGRAIERCWRLPPEPARVGGEPIPHSLRHSPATKAGIS